MARPKWVEKTRRTAGRAPPRTVDQAERPPCALRTGEGEASTTRRGAPREGPVPPGAPGTGCPSRVPSTPTVKAGRTAPTPRADARQETGRAPGEQPVPGTRTCPRRGAGHPPRTLPLQPKSVWDGGREKPLRTVREEVTGGDAVGSRRPRAALAPEAEGALRWEGRVAWRRSRPLSAPSPGCALGDLHSSVSVWRSALNYFSHVSSRVRPESRPGAGVPRALRVLARSCCRLAPLSTWACSILAGTLGKTALSPDDLSTLSHLP